MIHPFVRLFMAALAVLVASALRAAPPLWPEFDPAEFQTSQPTLDPEAEIETLFSLTQIDDSDSSVYTTTEFRRLRVYNERGLERLAKVEIPYQRGQRVTRIECRTYRPDGTVVTLSAKDIFDRETSRTAETRRRAKSFAPPGLVNGAVVEYTYRVTEDGWVPFFPMFFQTEYPTRLARLRYRPIPGGSANLQIRALFFGVPSQPFKRDQQGYYVFEATQLPAWKEEPYSLPPLQTRANLMLYYRLSSDALEAPQYWAARAKELHEDSQKVAKPTKAIQAKAQELIAGATTPEEQLIRLYDFCRTGIRHWYRNTHFTDEQRAKLPRNPHADDTLKRGHGHARNINDLFVALARGAGFDARHAYVNDRSFMEYTPGLAEPFVVNDRVTAVKVGATWRYYDPGTHYLPPGQLWWTNSATMLLVAEPKNGALVPVPSTPAAESVRHRQAQFTLTADGVLEGEVTITYTGQREAIQRRNFDGETEADQSTSIADEVKEFLPLAELTEIKVTGLDRVDQPVKVSYHLRVPEFAERTGSRLFVQPHVFGKGVPAMFTAEERKTLMRFSYPLTDRDQITIVHPEGFTIEAGSAPQNLRMGTVGSYVVSVGYSAGRRRIVYDRTFTREAIAIDPGAYAMIKGAFDAIQQRDAHTLTLRRADLTAPATPPPAPVPASPTPEASGPRGYRRFGIGSDLRFSRRSRGDHTARP